METVAAFVAAWKPGIDLVVPAPPSRARASRPVLVLAESIAKKLGPAYAPTCVSRSRELPELKNVYDYDERIRLLADAHGAATTWSRKGALTVVSTVPAELQRGRDHVVAEGQLLLPMPSATS